MVRQVFLATPKFRGQDARSRQALSSWAGRVTFHDDRVFVPLAVSGCGVGCKYCYIDRPASDVDPLPAARMRTILKGVEDYLKELPQGFRPIIAIGCDTEVGISPALAANALMYLDFAAEHRLPVQISTKFPLDQSLRQRLDEWMFADCHPVVFTTITSVSLSARIEPGAPTPATRATNFRQHSRSWSSYALIKPFLATSESDKEALLELLERNRPDGVVVGIRYRRKVAEDRPGDPHPVASGWIASPPSESAQRFAARLKEIGHRVFMNTQCVSAWHNSSSHGLVVKSDHPYLCVDCGACG
jgi:hypothetical protein